MKLVYIYISAKTTMKPKNGIEINTITTTKTKKNIDKIIDLTGMEGFHESIISTKTRNHFDHEMLS